jgi:hypothetical protein
VNRTRRITRLSNLTLSLTIITLAVGVINTNVFEYQKQVIFNMTVFDGGPLVVILALAFGIQTKMSFL